MMRLSLRQLECFVAAAETGTIIAGAQRTQASPAAVSLAIAELEKRLGLQLLIRQQAKGVVLTAAGGRLLGEARQLLAHADELLQSARSEGSAVSGSLTVGCFTTLAPFFIPPLLDEFSAEYPQIDLNLLDGPQDDLIEMLVTGRAELAVMYESDLGPNLEYTVLRRCRPYVILAVDHPLAGEPEVRLKDVADEPLITISISPGPQNSERVLTAAGLEPRVRYRTANIEMVRCLVARGLGYGILVQSWPNDVSYEGRQLVSKPIADPVEEHRVVLAKAKNITLTRRAELFAQHCVDNLSGEQSATPSVTTGKPQKKRRSTAAT